MEERGVVVEKGSGTARVRIERTSACHGCSTCLYSAAEGGMTAEVVDRLGASPGDRVLISTQAAAPLTASLLLFGLPLLLLFTGYAAGSVAARAAGLPALAQGFGIGGGVLFFAGSFLLVGLVSARMPGGRLGRPVIVEVLGRQDTPR